jgi:acyl carrier protein
MSTHSETEAIAGIRACLQAVLKLSDAEAAAITVETTPVQFPGWTSMVHLELVLALEARFGLMFEADEIADLASVAAIVAALAKERPR